MPKLPEDLYKELVGTYNLSPYDARVLTGDRAYVDYYLAVFAVCDNAKSACNWVTSELFGLLNKNGLDIHQSPVTAQHLGELIKLMDTDVISGKMAKTVFEEMFSSGKSPKDIVEAQGLKQITDDGAILAMVTSVLDANPKQLQDYLGGNVRLQGFFVGQIMKNSGGSANPKKVNQFLAEELDKRQKAFDAEKKK
jgi:aspartyl-tRNA(Asn)/glutamyl-tRNA(Gln) amidotransferase subunit B